MYYTKNKQCNRMEMYGMYTLNICVSAEEQ